MVAKGLLRMKLNVKRVYEAAAKGDGYRILVDRLWPRGLSKEHAKVDLWLKDVAPSNELRKWFGHDPEKWTEFRKRYRAELQEQGEALAEIKRRAKAGPVTLLYGAKDEEHNQAVALKEFIAARTREGKKPR